jgi:hypothetical protein
MRGSSRRSQWFFAEGAADVHAAYEVVAANELPEAAEGIHIEIDEVLHGKDLTRAGLGPGRFLRFVHDVPASLAIAVAVEAHVDGMALL